MYKFSYFLIFFILLVIFSCQQETPWTPAECNLHTEWTVRVNPDNVLSEYPRPMMVRENWINLNGLWDYAIVSADQSEPEEFPGRILVPFPVESCLSGVETRIDQETKLWYKTNFKIPGSWKNRRIFLHFEAVDWETTVWVNGNEVGIHKGGYDPFTFDITDYLKERGKQRLIVSVWDPIDNGNQPRGKQVTEPHGIWYTPVTGIWQTVWLEPLPEKRIDSYYVYTDIDNSTATFDINTKNTGPDDYIQLVVMELSNEIVMDSFPIADRYEMVLPNAKFWTPDNPVLYDMNIRLISNNQIIDEVFGYFGMRKISLIKEKDGINRLALNNEPLFQFGTLDQGFWPDGIYTAPNDEALCYDLEKTKELGFNILRKHVKVESRRFYYWCDEIGILIWQDMPSCSGYLEQEEEDQLRNKNDADQFEWELKQLIKTKFNHPSIVMWIPFNEGWGQYDTERIADYIKELDSTRLVNQASGWCDRGVGDVHDIHAYPGPAAPGQEAYRAPVLGEFGGLGLRVEGHMWTTENWGYQDMSDTDQLYNRYEQLLKEVMKMKYQPGLAAAVYTQTTDVETESNGLMTYDRKVIKMDAEKVRRINNELIQY